MATGLGFNTDLMNFLADHRDGVLAKFFLLSSFLGEVEGYILIVTLIYVMFDKRLAVRLAVLVLLTMTLNHILKIIIQNPRPFIAEGTYLEKWAVSAEKARELAGEYSTPSGHAMAGSAFYGYLAACTRNFYVRMAAVVAIVLTGLSRPYLGVHYLEDILIGWAIGLPIAFAAVVYAQKIGAMWGRLSYGAQIGVVFVGSAALWGFTIAVNGGHVGGQPHAFLAYAGFLTGIVIGGPLETAMVDFDPKRSTIVAKVLRYILSIAMTISALLVLDRGFSALADDSTWAGYALHYARYAIAGVVSIFVAPLVFTAIGLAKRRAVGAETRLPG